MQRLTKQQVKKIIELDKKMSELAKKYGVTLNAIKYHKSEEFRDYLRKYQRERYKKLTKDQKQKIIEKKREYQKQYHKKRYNSDQEFRKKQMEMSKKYQKERNK